MRAENQVFEKCRSQSFVAFDQCRKVHIIWLLPIISEIALHSNCTFMKLS